METGIIKYSCKLCKINYETYNGLWKHNKKYHVNICLPNDATCLPQMGVENGNNKKFICNICNKTYENRNSKYKHQKKCSEKKDEIKQLKIEFNEEINKLKVEMKKKSNKKIINNNNTNNGTIINNIVINKIGSENLLEFNDNEITQIFNKELEGIVTFIELLNFNERLPQNHSYCTTSLESKYLSTYNKETNTIEKDRKKYFFDKLLNTTIDRIQILYNSIKNTAKPLFNKIKQKQIEENITNLKSLKNYDFNNKILKEMINKMNLVTYNKRQIIQKTWHEDSDSDDDFQRDLEKETKEEFYKKIAMKEKLALEYEAKSETISSSSVKKLEIKPKPKKFVLKHDTVSSESDEEQSVKSEVDSNIFLEIYENK